MLAKVFSCAIVGLEAEIVEVEVDIIRGGPIFNLVGLPDAAVRESRDRVHSAIKKDETVQSRGSCELGICPCVLAITVTTLLGTLVICSTKSIFDYSLKQSPLHRAGATQDFPSTKHPLIKTVLPKSSLPVCDSLLRSRYFLG